MADSRPDAFESADLRQLCEKRLQECKLTPVERAAFILPVTHGFTEHEIATLLGLARSTVAQLRRIAREKLGIQAPA